MAEVPGRWVKVMGGKMSHCAICKRFFTEAAWCYFPADGDHDDGLRAVRGEGMSALRDYAREFADTLDEIGSPSLPYRLLAERGVDFVFSPLPDGEEYGFAKNCYGNATNRVLLGPPGLTYHEGLVVTHAGTVPHAWAVDDDGSVLDFTLRHNDNACPFCHGDGELHPTDHWDYRGHDDEDPTGTTRTSSARSAAARAGPRRCRARGCATWASRSRPRS